VQHGVLDATDIFVNRKPFRHFLFEERIRVICVVGGVTQVVLERVDEGIHRVGFTFGRTWHFGQVVFMIFLSSKIRDGSFDQLLLCPVDPLFHLSAEKLDPGHDWRSDFQPEIVWDLPGALSAVRSALPVVVSWLGDLKRVLLRFDPFVRQYSGVLDPRDAGCEQYRMEV
jgi:hypothetical protein